MPTDRTLSAGTRRHPVGPATVLVVVASLLLAACGFQLRGAADLPASMARTYIDLADPTTAFARHLDRQLRANGVDVVDEPDEAAAVLEISSARMTRRPLTISGTAQVREYELVFNVEYRLVDAAGDERIPRNSITLARSYSFDEQQILAATREEEFLRNDLSEAMVGQLLRRLEAGGRS